LAQASSEAARDVVQAAFAEALRKRETLRGEGALEAWIWRIALSLAFARRKADAPLPVGCTNSPAYRIRPICREIE
jgi:DNA-directed RNA polymerase specialized sigma24 family protein